MPVAIAILALLPPTLPAPAPPPTDFFTAVGLANPAGDGRKAADRPAPFAWMTDAGPLPCAPDCPVFGSANPFQQLLDRLEPDDRGRPAHAAGLIVDPGRWYFRQETGGGLFKRKTKLELADPTEVLVPYAGKDWKAQDKVQIPVPIPLAVAEQLFVYNQFDGSGDALNPQRTSLSGKNGVGLKWSLVANSELQVRYATLFSYANDSTLGRFQERAQPAVEVMARVPLVGPLALEYTGSAIPALTRADTDQLKQELRFAIPLRGNDELEFGARYRWDIVPTPTPWVDRAQLFLGVKLRH